MIKRFKFLMCYIVTFLGTSGKWLKQHTENVHISKLKPY